MRAYTVAAVAVTLAVPRKWVDNALSHHTVHRVSQARQGITRKLSPEAVTTLGIALRLVQTLSIPLDRALQLAEELIQVGGASAETALLSDISIKVDVSAITAETMRRLAEAVEITPTPRRGRPKLSAHLASTRKPANPLFPPPSGQ